MNDLVSIMKGKVVVSSLQVAEHFHKRHTHLLDIIKKPFGEREGADSGHLAMIATAEHILGNALAQMVNAGVDAKDIYWKMKGKAGRLCGALEVTP